MKSFIYTTLKLTFFLVSFFVWGQKISYKTVYTKDITPALIEELKEPKGFVLNAYMRNSNSFIPNYNGVISLGIDSEIIKENRAYPDYIMELELINKSPKVFIFDIIDNETKQKLKNIYIISQIEAIQYLTEKNKGFFFEREITLKKSNKNLKYSGIDDVTGYDYSMKLSGKDYSNSVLAFKNVNPSSVSNYVTPDGDGWIAKKEYVDKVNSVQAHKLYANSVNYLAKLFNSSDREKSYTVDYIKKWKENESLMTQYNSIVDEFTDNMENNRLTELPNQAKKLRGFLSNLNTNEKRQKKLYSYTLSSITLAHFLAGDYDSVRRLIDEKQVFDQDDSASSYYIKELNKIKTTQKINVTYKPVPDQLTYTKSILNKKTDKIENAEKTGYQNYQVTDFLTLNAIHKTTNPKYTSKLKNDSEFGIKTFLYTKLNGLRNSNAFYKKQNPEFYSKLKDIKKRKTEIEKEFTDYKTRVNTFINEYDYTTINNLVKKPSLIKLNEINNFTDLEKTLFELLIETYGNMYLINYYGNQIQIENYEDVNQNFIKSLEEYIEANKVIQKEPSEILLGLNLIKTQADATKLETKQRLNFMFRLVYFASKLTL